MKHTYYIVPIGEEARYFDEIFIGVIRTHSIMKLTCEEIEIIRIHMNAFKEKLCNQCRWNEAEEYQRIVDKLNDLYDAICSSEDD